jgi:hypothetical protein
LFFHFLAFFLYSFLSWFFIDHGRALTGAIAGQGTDPFIFIWSFAWWPWAIAHHAPLLHTDLMWRPDGVFLGWVTSVSALSLLLAPVTLLAGPVAAFNICILAAPVLAAWFGYRLCLRLTRDFFAAMIGGFLFGFSSYEMAQNTAVPNLSFIMFVPALLLVVLARLDDDLDRPRTVVLASLILICQFLTGLEIFTEIFLFGGLAWLAALLYLPGLRPRLRRLLIDGLFTGAIVIFLLSPVLLSMLRHFHYLKLPAVWPYFFVADILNFVVPAKQNMFYGAFAPIARHFRPGMTEVDAYLGLPLIIMIGLFMRRYGAAGGGRFLSAMFLAIAVMSLGPLLWAGGHYTRIVLPWTVFAHVPVLSFMLPNRFGLFVSLLAAIMAALWLAAPKPARRWRMALGLLSCAALLPRLQPWEPEPHSRFFQPGIVQAALGPNPQILVLPFAINGPSSFWQQEAGFSFSQTGGYLGFPPASMQHFPAVLELFGKYQDPDFAADLRDFCLATHTQYVVAGPGTSAAVVAALAGLNWPNRRTLDVTVFTVPASLGGATGG